MKGPDPRLAKTTLPIMPETGRELRRLLDLATTRNPQLQQVLLTDPGAAVAVFRQLEQTRPGASEQVGDAAHAVSLIGMQAFRGLIESLPEVDLSDAGNGVAPAGAYSEAAHAAHYAGEISAHKGLSRLSELSTAALLQNPAILALAALDPESAQRAAYAVNHGVPLDLAFGAELGEPLLEANRRLAEAWALPVLARQAMGSWDDFNPRPQVVKLSDQIAQATAVSWNDVQTETLTSMLGDHLGLDKDRARSWLHQQSVDAARKLRRFDYPLPGFQLLLMPGEIDEDDDDIPLMGGKRPHKAEQKPAAAPDLHATMGEVMKQIRQQAGTARVVFAMLNKDRSRLRTRLALGGNADDGIRRLDLDLSQKTLFAALMGKPQSLWLHGGNIGKYQAYLPPALRDLIDMRGAFLMSLFVGNRPLGLMYGDGADLDETGYRQFRTLCKEATSALTAGSRVAPPATDSASA